MSDEVKANSAGPIHWLSVENRNKLWNGMGANIPDGFRFKLFPGLLPILFSIVAIARPENGQTLNVSRQTNGSVPAWLWKLDVVIWIAFAVSIIAVGLDGTEVFRGVFLYVTSERVLALLAVAIIARLCIAYP